MKINTIQPNSDLVPLELAMQALQGLPLLYQQVDSLQAQLELNQHIRNLVDKFYFHYGHNSLPRSVAKFFMSQILESYTTGDHTPLMTAAVRGYVNHHRVFWRTPFGYTSRYFEPLFTLFRLHTDVPCAKHNPTAKHTSLATPDQTYIKNVWVDVKNYVPTTTTFTNPIPSVSQVPAAFKKPDVVSSDPTSVIQQFASAVKNACPTDKLDKLVLVLPALSGCVTSLVTLVNLSARHTLDTVSVVALVTNFVVSASACAVAFLSTTPTPQATGMLYSAVHRAVTNSTQSADVACAFNDSVTKLFITIVASFFLWLLSFTGLKVENTLFNNIRAATTIADLGTNIVEAITSLLSDGPTVETTRKDAILRAMTEADQWLAIPNNLIAAQKLASLREWVRTVRDFTKDLDPKTATNYAPLVNKLNLVDAKLVEIAQGITSSFPKAEPVGLYIHSKQGGLGKTRFATEYLPQVLSQALASVNSSVYTVQEGSNHFNEYRNEHTFFVDEVGSCESLNNGINVLQKINEMMSTTPVVWAGASLATKNQVPRPKLVVMASQYGFERLKTNLVPDSKAAQATRFIHLEMTDPGFDVNSGRYNQHHRKPDFSHIVWLTPEGTAVTTQELVDQIVARVVMADQSYRQLLGQKSALPNVKPFIDPNTQKPYECVDIAQFEPRTEPPVLTIAGLPGIGKTRASLTIYSEPLVQLGYRTLDLSTIPADQRHAQLQGITTPTVILADDVFDLTTSEGQSHCMNCLNITDANSYWIILTNFGPSLSYFNLKRYFAPKHWHPVQIFHPGLPRRLGWTANHENTKAVYYHASSQTCYDISTHKIYDYTAHMQRTARLQSGQNFVSFSNDFPTILPFKKADSDIWLELNQDDTQNLLVGKMLTAASPRILPFLTNLSPTIFEGPQLELRLRQFVMQLSGKVKHPKLYVSTPQGEFCLNDKHIYFKNQRDSLFLEEKLHNTSVKLVHQRLGHNWYFTREDYDQMQQGQVPATVATDPAAPEVYQVLARSKTLGDSTWNEICKNFPPTFAETLNVHFASLEAARTVIASHLKSHWWFYLALTGLVVGFTLLYNLYNKDSTTTSQTAFESKVHYDDFYCYFCTDLKTKHCCPVLHPHLDPDSRALWDVASKGGKGKGGGRKTTRMSSKIKFGGVQSDISDADTELSQYQERVIHDLRRFADTTVIAAGPGSKQFNSGGMSYTARWDWNHNNQLTFDVYYDGDIPASGEAHDFFPEHQVSCFNENGKLYGTLMNDHIVRLPLHIFVGGPDNCTMLHGSNTYNLKKIYQVPESDVAYALVTDTEGRIQHVPGIKSLHNNLLSLTDLPKIQEAVVHAPSDYGYVHALGPYQYVPRLYYPIVNETQNWNLHAGLVPMGRISKTLLRQGHCGTQITTVVNNKNYLIGQYVTMRRTTQQYAFNTVTVEEWNTFCESMQSSDQASSDPQLVPDSYAGNYTYYAHEIQPPHNPSGQKVLLPVQLLAQITEPTAQPYYQPTGPSNAYLGEVKNFLPLDTKNTKRPLKNFAFAPVFGNLKSPALSLNEIEHGFPDRIPPDAQGNLRGFNIRLSNSEHNGRTPPVFIEDWLHAARQLGTIHRGMLGQNAPNSPLNIEQAIWGIPDKLDPMKRNTSTGAAFQLLFPGIVEKGQIWTENRGEFVGAQGAFVQRFAADQYKAAKARTKICFPSTLSMKSECLVNEKAWKKRIIHVVDPATVINQRRIWMPLQKAMATLGMHSPFILEANPIMDYDAIAARLLQHPYHASIDASSFDLTVPQCLLQVAAQYMAGLYNASDKLENLLLTFLEGMGHSPVLAATSLIQKSSGVNSGISNTSFVDSVLMLCLTLGATIYHSPLYADAINFHKNVATISCGDDTTMAWSQELYESGFSVLTVAHFADVALGMKITPDSKDGSLQPYLPLDELSFCSRFFTRMPGHNFIWMGRLKEAAMSSALCWTAYESDEEASDHLKMFGYEFVAYPDDYYNNYAQIAREQFGIVLPPIQQLRAEVVEGVLHAQQPQNNNSLLHSFSLTVFDLLEPTKSKPFVFKNNTTTTFHQRNMKSATLTRLVRFEFYTQDTAKHYQQLIDFVKEHPESLTKIQLTGRFVDLPPYLGPTFWASYFDAQDTVIPWQILLGLPEPTGSTRRDANTAKWKAIATARNLFHLGDKDASFTILATLHIPMPSIDMPCMEREGTVARSSEQSTGPIAPAGTGNHNSAEATTSSTAADSSPHITNVLPKMDAAPPVIMPSVDPPATNAPSITALASQIGPELLTQMGFAADIVGMCATDALVKQIFISTGMSQGTVLLDEQINPWNPNILNLATRVYADLHTQFIGKLTLGFELKTASPLFGQIAVYVLPEAYKNSSLTPQTLDYFARGKIDVQTGGTFSIDLNLTTSDNAVTAVSRGSGKSYGRLVVLTRTLIGTSFSNNTNSVPLLVNARLDAEGFYFNPSFIMSPISPDHPDTIPPIAASQLVADGIYMDVANPGYVNPDAEAGYAPIMYNPEDDSLTTLEVDPNGTSGDALFSWVWGADIYSRSKVAHYESVADIVNNTLDAGTVVPARYTGNISFYNFSYPSSANPQDTDIVYTAQTIVSTGIAGRPINTFLKLIDTAGDKYYYLPKEAEAPLVVRLGTTVVPTSNEQDHWAAAHAIFLMSSGMTDSAGSTTDPQPRHSSDDGRLPTRFKIEGGLPPIAEATATGSPQVAAGYRAVRLIDYDQFIPGVLQGNNGTSVYPGKDHSTTRVLTNKFLDDNPSYQSIVTTLSSTNGQLLAVILRNRDGMFLQYRETDAPLYTTLNGEIHTMRQEHIPRSEKYPILSPSPMTAFSTREATGSFVGRPLAVAVPPKLYRKPTISNPFACFNRKHRPLPTIREDVACASAVLASMGSGFMGDAAKAAGNVAAAALRAEATKYAADRNLAGVKYTADVTSLANYNIAQLTSQASVRSAQLAARAQVKAQQMRIAGSAVRNGGVKPLAAKTAAGAHTF